MKIISIALTAVLVICFGSIALGDEPQGPVIMTDTQMEDVVAGYPQGRAWGFNDRNQTDQLIYNWGGIDEPQNVGAGDKFTARPYGVRANNYMGPNAQFD